MNVIAFDKRLRKLEERSWGRSKEMRSMTDDELIRAYRAGGPLSADDEAFIPWFLDPAADLPESVLAMLRRDRIVP